MGRLNTNAEVIAEVTEVGVMTDVTSSPGSTTVATAVAAGATALVVASGTNFTAADRFRIGNRPLMEAGEIESVGVGTDWTLMSALADAYAIGEPVVEVEDTVVGDITEDGIRIVWEGGDQAVQSGTKRGAYAFIPSSDQGISVQFSMLNHSQENLAMAAGVAESSITGAGTAADPYVLHLREDLYAAELARVWYWEGARIDAQIVRVEANGGRIYAPQGEIRMTQGAPTDIPLILRVLHGIKIAQYSS